MEAEGATRPLLHVGYHKTGSTWLGRHVFADPKAGFAVAGRPREIHEAFVAVNPFGFAPGPAAGTFAPRLREAEGRGLVPVLSHERLSGNPHSGGFDGAAVAERLAASFPDARVLVVIREQAAMLVSLYKQYVKRGGAMSFGRYVGTPPARGPLPAFRFDFLEYHRLVGRYQDLFGVENVLVLSHELLRAEPRAFLERLGAFAGAPATKAEVRLENTSPSALSLGLKRHANRYLVRDATNPTPPLPLDPANGWLLRACRVVDGRAPAPLREGREKEWRERAEHAARGRYAASNALTAELTGLDLPAFGYDCA